MNKKSLKILNPILMLCLFAWQSCNKERNIADFNRLQRIDAICDSLPAAAADSLASLNPNDLSRSNRAYYGLLKTIADDKTYTLFACDSLINSVENYFRRHEKGSDNHIRTLIYQGIVRIRMGIADSTAFEPLKNAVQILQTQKEPNNTLLYFANYHIGDMHEKNGNDSIAAIYFQEALKYAKKENIPSHLFQIYYKVFWRPMRKEQFSDARPYLDTLALYSLTPDDQYLMLDAQAFYLDTQEKYENAIQKEKEQLALAPQLKEKAEYFKIYYSLSNRYYNLNLLDSAFHYACLSVAHIPDSTYRYNYLLYDNAADIAADMGNYRLADDYRQQALDTYGESVENRLDTRILELEKRYNLSEAENKILKTEAHNRFLFAVLLVLVMVIGVAAFMINRRRKIVRLEQKNKESELQLAQQQAFEKERMTRIIIPYLSLYTTYQNELKALTYKKIGVKEGEDGKEYDKIVKIKKENFNKITQHLFTDELLSNVLKTRNGLDKFKLTDRMLLFMLAVGADNSHIVALLNTTPDNLKAKKSYLKKKIQKHASCFDDSDYLLSLFPSFSNP